MAVSPSASLLAKDASVRDATAAPKSTSRERAASTLTAGLDALAILNIGLVMCDPAGKVLDVNSTASGILASKDDLQVSEEGRLCATHDPLAVPEIVRRVARQAPSEGSGRSQFALAVHRDGAKPPLTLLFFLSSLAVRPATVLVMIFDPGLPIRTAVAELRLLYGLTPTEARLGNLLMEGKSLEVCCRELAISRSTACTHLRRLFTKTGVHRQSQLVRILLRSIGLAYLGPQNYSWPHK